MIDNVHTSSTSQVRVKARLLKVVLEDVFPVAERFPEGVPADGMIIDTKAEFGIDEGILDIRFTFDCKLGNRGDEVNPLLFSASLLCRNELTTDSGSLPLNLLPLLDETFVTDLIKEAYATLRGCVHSLLRNSILDGVLLPYVNPTAFLGDFRIMLDTKELPSAIKKQVTEEK